MTFFNFLYVKAKEVDGLSKLCLNHFQIPSALVHNSYKLTGPRFRVQRHIEISSPCIRTKPNLVCANTII